MPNKRSREVETNVDQPILFVTIAMSRLHHAITGLEVWSPTSEISSHESAARHSSGAIANEASL